MKSCPNCGFTPPPGTGPRLLCDACLAPFRNDSIKTTSLEAYERAKARPDGSSLICATRHAVLGYLYSVGRDGATDQEMQNALRIGPQTQTPSRRTLAKEGLVENSGRKRLTTSGRNAIVWIVASLA